MYFIYKLFFNFKTLKRRILKHMKIFDGSNETLVRLVTDDGLKEMTAEQAYETAYSEGLDVIYVSEKDGTPIVKIGDYKKLLFDQKKKAKENTKKQRGSQSETKEIRLNSVIAEHDMEIKAKQIDRILTEGDKVYINIRFKGRAAKQVATGKDKIDKMLSFVTVPYSVVKPSVIDDNKVTMTIGPKK